MQTLEKRRTLKEKIEMRKKLLCEKVITIKMGSTIL